MTKTMLASVMLAMAAAAPMTARAGGGQLTLAIEFGSAKHSSWTVLAGQGHGGVALWANDARPSVATAGTVLHQFGGIQSLVERLVAEGLGAQVPPQLLIESKPSSLELDPCWSVSSC